jgi:hypothetical protein
LCFIESTVSAAAPPAAAVSVVTVIFVNPEIAPLGVNADAPFASSTLLAIYFSITILPSPTALPTRPSPK